MSEQQRKRAAVLARVSTDGQEEHGTSLPDQLAQGREHAEGQKWEVVAELSETISGATPYRERPAVSDLLNLAAGGEVDVAIWATADREGRGRDIEDMEEALASLGVEVWTVESGRRSRVSADDIIVEGIRDLVARGERFRIQERLARGRYNKAKDGRWVFGKAPRGYVRDAETGRLVIEEVEAAAVLFVFESIAAGKTPSQVAKGLNDQGHPFKARKNKAVEWSSGHVHNLLIRASAAAYAGDGFRQTIRLRGLPTEQPETIFIPAPAIISEELRDAALEERRKTMEVTLPRPRRVFQYPLSGRVAHRHPDGTEEPMSGRKSGSNKVRRMKCRASFKRHQTAHGLAPCPGFGLTHTKVRQTSVAAGVIEARATLMLTEALRDEETLAAFAARHHQRSEYAAKVADNVESVEEALTEVEAEQDRLAAQYVKAVLPVRSLDKQAEELRAKEAGLKERLVILRSEVAVAAAVPSLEDLKAAVVGVLHIEPGAEGTYITNPATGQDWVEEPGWGDVLDFLAREAQTILDGDRHEPSDWLMAWLEAVVPLIDLRVFVEDIGEDVPGVRFTGAIAMVPESQPLTPRGGSRGTPPANPARWQGGDTASVPLGAWGITCGKDSRRDWRPVPERW